MFRKSMLVVIPLCLTLAIFCSQASAQYVVPGPQGPVVQPGPVYNPPVVYQQYPQGMVTYPGNTYPGNTYTTYYPPYYRPSVPVAGTPSTITTYNPQTGGWNTASSQWNNTYWDPGRNASQYNNRRWVQRPVYNTMGQITGYQEGWVWNNAWTGQEHGNVQTYTPNATGGVNQGQILYSRDDGGGN